MRSVSELADDAFSGNALSRDSILALLEADENSEIVSELIGSVDSIVRSACGNNACIGAQIGVHIGPCYARCKFCSLSADVYPYEDYVMGIPELENYLHKITESGVVSSVSLMTIHDFSFDSLLNQVKASKRILPNGVELAVNTGDLSESQCMELKSAGVTTAYHAFRLGEGVDNMLEPFQRVETLKNLLSAGIQVATGIEPIGPEHSSREILDRFLSLEGKCSMCSASARETVPGTPLAPLGAISPRRLLQIRSALVLAGMGRGSNPAGMYGGFYGGFNRFYAEYGGSPKDNEEITEYGLGRTVDWACRQAIASGYLVPGYSDSD